MLAGEPQSFQAMRQLCRRQTVRLSGMSFCFIYANVHDTGAEATLKRFWKTVSVEEKNDAFAVTLDKRPLKTPSGNQLLFPRSRIMAATLVASEWDNQETLLKQHSLPVVSNILWCPCSSLSLVLHNPNRPHWPRELLTHSVMRLRERKSVPNY